LKKEKTENFNEAQELFYKNNWENFKPERHQQKYERKELKEILGELVKEPTADTILYLSEKYERTPFALKTLDEFVYRTAISLKIDWYFRNVTDTIWEINKLNPWFIKPNKDMELQFKLEM